MGPLENSVENRAYAGAATGSALGLATGTGVLSCAVGGGAVAATLPLYYRALEQMNPKEDKTARAAKASLLAFGTGYVAPVLVTWTAGVVAGALLTAALPIAFVAYKVYTHYPQVATAVKYVQYASSFIPAKKAPETAPAPVPTAMPHARVYKREEDKQGQRVFTDPGYVLLDI